MNGQLREGCRSVPGCASAPPQLQGWRMRLPLNIPFEFVVVDTLHLFLRIMGLLFHQLTLKVLCKEIPFPWIGHVLPENG